MLTQDPKQLSFTGMSGETRSGKSLSTKQALREAVDALAEKRRKYAFDANLARKGIGGFYGGRALVQYTRLQQAQEILQRMIEALR